MAVFTRSSWIIVIAATLHLACARADTRVAAVGIISIIPVFYELDGLLLPLVFVEV